MNHKGSIKLETERLILRKFDGPVMLAISHNTYSKK